MKDTRPRLGVALLVPAPFRIEASILLGKRGRGPNAGKWVIPGGGVEFRESWKTAGERELYEETGLIVKVTSAPVHIMEIIGPDSHRVCLVALAEVTFDSPLLKPSEELPELMFFSYKDIPVADLSPPVRACLEVVNIINKAHP